MLQHSEVCQREFLPPKFRQHDFRKNISLEIAKKNRIPHLYQTINVPSLKVAIFHLIVIFLFSFAQNQVYQLLLQQLISLVGKAVILVFCISNATKHVGKLYFSQGQD